jgi:hypothetical protein
MMGPAIVCLLTAVVLTGAAAPAETTVSDLIDNGSDWAGLEVTVEGELIGDYGFRHDGWMWTQLNGDDYVGRPISEGGPAVGGNSGIGVRMPAGLGEGLDPPGRYGTRGPVVRVTGIWKWHDSERQGESFLEADSVEVIQSGRTLKESPDRTVIVIGVVLVLLIPVLWPRRRPISSRRV